MSNTPRTDACAFAILSDLQSGTRQVVDANVARELERENATLRETLELAIHVRGTSDDTPEVAAKMEAALGR